MMNATIDAVRVILHIPLAGYSPLTPTDSSCRLEGEDPDLRLSLEVRRLKGDGLTQMENRP